MSLANPEPWVETEVVNLVDRLRADRLPPPPERRTIRRRARASLKDVAQALGVDIMTVSRWERGKADPWPRHRAAYIRALRALAELAVELESQHAQK
ncbi:helix-turn-helix domain-containing protein [Paractinoplanes toevensis]|uniref:HTH cro/C1-type domain-containing protein n=1 Tax=Paractinoplanes toevensis TaxID=571911 RepID=A0A919T4H9_9ACTN|nr:helix-turn-helix transcriptional regulator [Actinoplanes toevensis]GIM88723.1 hypothetical protein Ato02nite_005160 [Actinoplanes toevensis]